MALHMAFIFMGNTKTLSNFRFSLQGHKQNCS